MTPDEIRIPGSPLIMAGWTELKIGQRLDHFWINLEHVGQPNLAIQHPVVAVRVATEAEYEATLRPEYRNLNPRGLTWYEFSTD